MKEKDLQGKVLAIDWGEKRIGLALSDETQTLAKPIAVIAARSRAENADQIVKIAIENGANGFVIGVTFDREGKLTPIGRRADRLAHVLENDYGWKVARFDESLSTRDAKANQILMGTRRKKRRGHLDDKAAAFFLQKYLDWKENNE